MRTLTLLLVLSAQLFAVSVFSTKDGRSIKGDIVNVYGSVVLFEARRSAALWPLDDLDDASLDRVAEHLESNPTAPAVPWKSSQSILSSAVKGELMIFDGARMLNFDPGERPEPEFYVVYFSAHWCGPCRAFTPKLVDAYTRLKAVPSIADRFEFIFVSDDEDRPSQEKYVRSELMRWPFVHFVSRRSIKPFEKWRGDGIPCLVVLNREGKLLFHTYDGEKYQGPELPLQRFFAFLSQMEPAALKTLEGPFRLERRRHLLRGRTKDLPPTPYLCSLDWSQLQGLEPRSFKALVSIDDAGKVTDVSTEPELTYVYDANFRRQASNWLFLPAIRNGNEAPAKIVIPIRH